MSKHSVKPFLLGLLAIPIVLSQAEMGRAQEAATPANPSVGADAPSTTNPVLAIQFKQGVAAYDSKRYTRAFELWLPLAQNGDLAAQRNVAHLLRRGLGVDQDLPRARKFYEQSAEFGFVTAQTNLGVMLLEGEGGKTDPDEAAYWFDRAARGGHPIAQFHLARLYETGTGVMPNPGRALGWYALAARSGHQASLDRLADLVMTLPGPSTEREKSEAATELVPEPQAPKKADAPIGEQEAVQAEPVTNPLADEDSVEEGADLVQAKADYAARRFKDAQTKFETLAYKGSDEAQYQLGRMRNRGESEPRDPVAALAWWTVAAEAGHSRAARAARDLASELGPRRRSEAKREAAQFKALITQLTSGN
ncbi:MAG: SEL1-like repeat protein [Candidatus Phaeomarinobacter sp.]